MDFVLIILFSVALIGIGLGAWYEFHPIVSGVVFAVLIAWLVYVIWGLTTYNETVSATTNTPDREETTVTATVEHENLWEHQAVFVVETLEPLEAPCGLSQEEIDLLAAIVYLEAGGESAEGQQAVVEVILNRLLSDDFPDTITEIIFQTGQFESVSRLDKADPGEAQYNAIREAIEGERILPEEVVFFSRNGENDSVWGRIGNHVFCYSYTG